MRKKLGKLKNRCYTFTGKVGKVSKKAVLVLNVRLLEGKHICGHIWIPKSKAIWALHLKEGDRVRFRGMPGIYYKGLDAATLDFRIANVSEFRVTKRKHENKRSHVVETEISEPEFTEEEILVAEEIIDDEDSLATASEIDFRCKN